MEPWDKLNDLHEKLLKEYKDAVKKYTKKNSTSVLIIAQRTKNGWKNEDEKPLHIYFHQDYAYQTQELLATKVTLHDTYITVDEQWDDKKDRTEEYGLDCNLWRVENIGAIANLIDLIRQQ